MMPIAVLESLASGVPVVAHKHPVLEWMIGAGGENTDMHDAGELRGFLASLNGEWIVRNSPAARERALAAFSKKAVIDDYIKLYSRVMRA